MKNVQKRRMKALEAANAAMKAELNALKEVTFPLFDPDVKDRLDAQSPFTFANHGVVEMGGKEHFDAMKHGYDDVAFAFSSRPPSFDGALFVCHPFVDRSSYRVFLLLVWRTARAAKQDVYLMRTERNWTIATFRNLNKLGDGDLDTGKSRWFSVVKHDSLSPIETRLGCS